MKKNQVTTDKVGVLKDTVFGDVQVFRMSFDSLTSSDDNSEKKVRRTKRTKRSK